MYGPSSVGYGSDALGGVVHYFTKEPRVGDAQPWRFFIANSYDIRHENSISHVDITHSNDKWASLTSASYSIFGDIYMGRQRNHGYPDWGLVSEISKNNRYFFRDQPQSNPNPNRQFNTKYDQIYLMQKLVFQPNAENKWVNFQYPNPLISLALISWQSDWTMSFVVTVLWPSKAIGFLQNTATTDKKWLREGDYLAYQQIEDESATQI